VISAVGKQNEDQLIYFSGGDLYSVTGVHVDAGSPLTRTLEGRLEVVSVLGQHQISLPKEELVSILNGAPLDAILQGQAQQLELVSSENEELMKGGEHIAMPTDNHLLHMKKHAELMNSSEVRLRGEINEEVLASIEEHLQLYNDPNHFRLQMALGYAQVPIMPNDQMGGGSGPPPEGGQQVQQESEELQGVT
jgi:hypothetical protein